VHGSIVYRRGVYACAACGSFPRALTNHKRNFAAKHVSCGYNRAIFPLNLRRQGAGRLRAALLFSYDDRSSVPLKSAVPLTNVYVDGFNLYYGAAKNTPFKWVNLAALCEAVLPGIRIGHIRYFTALVSAMPGDPDHQQRAEDSRWDLQPAHCGYGEAEQCSSGSSDQSIPEHYSAAGVSFHEGDQIGRPRMSYGKEPIPAHAGRCCGTDDHETGRVVSADR